MSTSRFVLLLCLMQFSLALYSADIDIKFDRISREDGLSSSTIYSIIEDEKGFIWFGTPDGLNKFDGTQFTVFKSNLNNSLSIPHNSAGNLYIDPDGIIWIGTWGGGLIRFNPKLKTFKSYKYDPEDNQSISGNRVQSLFYAEAGEYWFGTYQGGLNKFDSWIERFRSFQTEDDKNSISNNRVWSIIADADKNLWIGTSNGLNLFDDIDYSFITIEGTEDYIIRNQLITDNNLLWFGTNDGLFCYDIELNNLKETQFTDRIYALFEDSKGIIWIGTSEGLIRYDYKNDSSHRYTHVPENKYSLSINKIRVIFEDSSGIMWIGTDGGGLCRFDNNPTDFTHYYPDETKSDYLLLKKEHSLIYGSGLRKDCRPGIWIPANITQFLMMKSGH